MTSWGDFVALALTERGPAHLPRADLGPEYCGGQHTYYTAPFADFLLATSLCPAVKGRQRRTYNAQSQYFIAEVREVSPLTPWPERTLRDMQMTAAGGRAAREVVAPCLDQVAKTGDFEVLAHDGTPKAAMGVIGQPKYGEQVQRDVEGGPRRGFLGNREGEVHVAQTPRTGTGWAVGARAVPSPRASALSGSSSASPFEWAVAGLGRWNCSSATQPKRWA